MVPSSPATPTRFLDIPLELRRQIYHYLLVREDPIIVKRLLGNPYTPGQSQGLHSNILCVSKQINHEALEVLYGDNTFHVSLESGGFTSLDYVFTSTIRLQIRKLQLVIQDKDQVWQSLKFRPKLWEPILAGLKILTIVVKQPGKMDTYQRVPSLGGWITWVGPMVAYMAEQLPESVNVEVDDDGREDVGVLMEEAFPGGYRKVRTKFGDSLFKRRALAAK
jgi:hypothetical protein